MSCVHEIEALLHRTQNFLLNCGKKKGRVWAKLPLKYCNVFESSFFMSSSEIKAKCKSSTCKQPKMQPKNAICFCFVITLSCGAQSVSYQLEFKTTL